MWALPHKVEKRFEIFSGCVFHLMRQGCFGLRLFISRPKWAGRKKASLRRGGTSLTHVLTGNCIM